LNFKNLVFQWEEHSWDYKIKLLGFICYKSINKCNVPIKCEYKQSIFNCEPIEYFFNISEIIT